MELEKEAIENFPHKGENTNDGHEEDSLLRLKTWIDHDIMQNGGSLRSLNHGCHCGETCGAWYNLS